MHFGVVDQFKNTVFAIQIGIPDFCMGKCKVNAILTMY